MIDNVVYPLLGGLLLGISASLLLLFNGKVAGISGILNGLFLPKNRDFSWRLLFVAGLVIGGALAAYGMDFSLPTSFSEPGWLIAAAGLLVGIGTRLGNGCTSGHGICGMGRLSPRSIVATVVFMLVAGVTVFVRLHVL